MKNSLFNSLPWDRIPVHLLRLIRDGRLRRLDDLNDSLGTTEEFWSANLQLKALIQHSIDALRNAGYIVESEAGYEAVPLVHNLRSVLGISLAEIAEKPVSGMWVDPVFKTVDSGEDNCDVFVVMPFSDNLRAVYDDHIREVVNRLGLSVARADDFFTTHAIVDDIWSGIVNSKVIIADCTSRNPNVFYEIGIAHTVGKPVVLIAQSASDVPFDVQHWRCITYELSPRGMSRFQESLLATLRRYTQE